MYDAKSWQAIESRPFRVQGVPSVGTLFVLRNIKRGYFVTFTSDSAGVEEFGDRYASAEEAKVGAEKEIGANVLSKSRLYFDGTWKAEN